MYYLYTYWSRLTRLTGGGLLSRFGTAASFSRRPRSISRSRLRPPAVFDLLQQKCNMHCSVMTHWFYKKAQLSLTNPRDAKACQNCSNSTCLQRCRWQYWPIFMRLTAIASEIREIPRNSLKIQTYGVQGHPRSSILVSIESPYVTCY